MRRVLNQFQVVLGVDNLALGEREVAANRELRLVDHRRQAAVGGHVAEEVLQARDKVAAALLERRLHRHRVGQERVGRGERVDDEIGGDPGAQLVARGCVEPADPGGDAARPGKIGLHQGAIARIGSPERVAEPLVALLRLDSGAAHQAAQHGLAGGQRPRPRALRLHQPRSGQAAHRQREIDRALHTICEHISSPFACYPTTRASTSPTIAGLSAPSTRAAASRRSSCRPAPLSSTSARRKQQATSAPAGTGARKRTLSRP